MDKLKPPVSRRDHLKGRLNAPVVILEYGDYQCPFCGKAYYVIKELLSDKGDKVAYAFRNFPLTDIHPQAMPAALAAEAADMQGKFWQMYAMIFEDQSLLEPEYLLAYAESVGLDTDRFMDDIQSEQAAQRVEEDMASGLHNHVESTPTFFINNMPYDGPYDLGILSVIVDSVSDGSEYKKVKDNHALSRSKQ